MRTLLASACAALLLGCTGAPPGVDQDPNTSDGLVTDGAVAADELIVAVMPGADADELEALFAEAGATVRDRLTELSVVLLGVDPTQRDEVSETLGGSPLVEDVLDNRLLDIEVLPNDPGYSLQWYLAAIEAPAAWNITTGSEQILVAVLDTGVDAEHPDLAPKLRAGGNTFDGTSGWQDRHGHGTAVAGIIAAAADNEEGIASIAWKNPILPIRVTDGGQQSTSWAVAAGIALAVNEGARVINVSLTPLHHDPLVLRQATLAQRAGSLVVFAAGNEGQEVSAGGSDSALFVGAVDQNGELAASSNFGQFVDLVAPGVSIYTTQLGGGYGAWTGTSFAAPIVSGVAALVWSVNPDLRPVTVEGILLATATDLGPAGDDVHFGAGQVNARAAVELAQTIVEQRDEAPPAISIARPAAGALISGVTIVEVQTTDDDIADVTLFVDDTLLATDVIAPYAFVLDAGKFGVGEHTLSARARDLSGNSSQQQISLVFGDSQDTVRPSVSIVSPIDNSVVRGVVTILADAADDRLLARAEVSVDEQLIASITIGSAETTIAYNWDTSAAAVSPGGHTLTVRVIDASGNAASASVHVTIG